MGCEELKMMASSFANVVYGIVKQHTYRKTKAMSVDFVLLVC
jgi:hypothetical protein